LVFILFIYQAVSNNKWLPSFELKNVQYTVYTLRILYLYINLPEASVFTQKSLWGVCDNHFQTIKLNECDSAFFNNLFNMPRAFECSRKFCDGFMDCLLHPNFFNDVLKNSKLLLNSSKNLIGFSIFKNT